MYLSSLIVLCLVARGAFCIGYSLPSYFGRCSQLDLNLNKCIIEKANLVIPSLAKGDVDLGIPSSSPIKFKKAPVQGNRLELLLTNTYCDDIKNLKVTDCNFDLKKGKVAVTFVVNQLAITADTYKFISGQLIDIPVSDLSGDGRFNLTLEGVTIYYTAHVRTIVKNLEAYMDVQNIALNTTVTHLQCAFENIQSRIQSDVNAYVAKNWAKFLGQLEPAIDYYLKDVFKVINLVASKVPLNKLFLP